MDRGVVNILEDEEEDKKPIIGGALALGEHPSIANSSTYHPLQSSGGMAHNLQSIQSFGQITGLPSQEKSRVSANSTLQQPMQQQFIPQQQGGAQQGDKGHSSNLIKRPGGPAQAISFGTLMPMLLPILPSDKAQKLNALYLRLKRSEITKEDFLRATRMLVGDQILVATVKQMQIKQVGESSSGHGGVAVNTNSSLNAQPGNSSLMPSTMAAPPAPLNIPDSVASLPIAASGSQVRTPPKRASSDQRKSADVSPMTQAKSKKQKVAGDDLEQSIDQLNDVTAVSGVNLREEEEQLLAGPKEESRSTQAMRRFAQEEEGRLFLERGPLRTKVNAIATKHGVSIVSKEAEQCLSMSVEEQLRNMLYMLTKISSRRCDHEKEMHKLVVTSDIQKQIVLIRKKAKEALERKQAIESERFKKINEEKEKASQNDGASKEDGTTSQKKKGEEGKQKANAASMTARSANDMLLKWQMMAEQGRQKREGESGTSANDTIAVTNIGATNFSGRELDKKHGNLEAKQLGRATTADGGLATTGQRALKMASGDIGISRGFAHQASLLNHQPAKPLCPITGKDIIAYLETEPQMAKSPLIYRLYDKNLAFSQAV